MKRIKNISLIILAIPFLLNLSGCKKDDPFKDGLEPAKTLFIDDFEENCVSAREAGLVAHQLMPDENLQDALGKFNIVI
ncbi:hypothetical protein ES708_29431 [subsurface metagenome]